jgi:hypothetical protein
MLFAFPAAMTAWIAIFAIFVIGEPLRKHMEKPDDPCVASVVDPNIQEK